jgi:hypothetical protein
LVPLPVVLIRRLPPGEGLNFHRLSKIKQELDAEIEQRFPIIDIAGGVMVELLPYLQELIKLRGLAGLKLEIIVGADGRAHTRQLSSIMCGFMIGNEGARSQQSEHYYTLAIFDTKEKRPNIDGPMKAIYDQFRALGGKIPDPDHPDDPTKFTEFVWKTSNDMKFTSAVGGVSAANACGDDSESCPWCLVPHEGRVSPTGVHRNYMLDKNRYDQKNLQKTDLLHGVRTIDRVIDSLHLGLRVTDRLLKCNLLFLFSDPHLTQADKTLIMSRMTQHLKDACKVKFDFFVRAGGGDTIDGKLGYTSLQGPQQRRCLQHLKWRKVFDEDRWELADRLQKLWDGWYALHTILKSKDPLNEPQLRPIGDVATPTPPVDAATPTRDLSASEQALLTEFEYEIEDLSEDPDESHAQLQAMTLLSLVRVAPMQDDDTTKSGIPVLVADEWNLKFHYQKLPLVAFEDDWELIKDKLVGQLASSLESGDIEPIDVDEVEEKEEAKVDEEPSSTRRTLDELQQMCTAWSKQFTAGHILTKDGTLVHLGYGPKHVTPYVHAVARHCCEFIREHGSLWRFSCQSLERRNAAHTRQLLQNGLMRTRWPRRMLQRDLRLLVNAYVARGKYECLNACGHPPFSYLGSFRKHKC